MKTWKSPPLILGLALALVLGTQAHAFGSTRKHEPKIETPASDLPAGSVTFQEALEKRRSGLSLVPVTERKIIDLRAEEFVRYRQGSLRGVARAEFLAACVSPETVHPFCPYLIEDAKEFGDVVPMKYQNAPPEVGWISRKLQANDFAGLEGISRGTALKALDSVSGWDSYKPMVEKVLSQGSCLSPHVLIAYALKAEDYFPEDEAREKALRLYERTIKCSKEPNETLSVALYRHGMIEVWNRNCSDADSSLERLGEIDKEEKYKSRVLFWRAYCAKQRGKESRYLAYRKELIEYSPMGFHTFALNQYMSAEQYFNPIDRLAKQESGVKFRSEQYPAINPYIIAAEVLEHKKKYGYVSQMLEDIEPLLEKTEAEFQLYVAALAKRTGTTFVAFRTMGKIYQERPDLMGPDVVKAFFPLERFSMIRKHTGERLDPFLVAALIRQESGFNPRARSPAGAVGLMQLMPATARVMERRVGRGALLTPEANIRIGVKYLSSLLRRYDRDMELSLAAYNAGPHNLDAWRRRYPTENRMLFLDLIPFSETRNYVALIGRNYYWYVNLYDKEPMWDSQYFAQPATSRVPASPIKGRTRFEFRSLVSELKIEE